MKFIALRHYLKNKNLEEPHTLSDCDLVIDGDSFFKDTYRSSRCQFILGPDCDKYADYIIKRLNSFIDNDVKCYVIFRGIHKHNLEKRKEIHQSIIDDRLESNVDHVGYFTPALVNIVQKQVLEKMDIKYFVCEQDSLGAIVGVARKLKCPVLTDKLEYSLFGVSCIPTNSVEYHDCETKLKCKIYDHEEVKTAFGVYNKMPILLALFNESGDYLDSLKQIIEYVGSDVVGPVVRWVKRQREATLFSKIANSIDDEDQNRIFKEVYEKIQIIYCYPLCHLAVKYFQRDKAHDLLRDDKKWLAKAVASGKIALPYVTLKKNGLIRGSTLMFDCKQPDALLPAIDIIAYSHCLLTNSQVSNITLLERKGRKSSVKEIETHWDTEISNRDLYTKYRVGKKLKTTTPQAFDLFLEEVLPEYDFKNLLLTVPENCWILIITLVYYIVKKNKDFINGAYCILLSYFMLGPVSRNMSSMKKNILAKVSPSAKDSEIFYDRLQFLFENVNLGLKYDSGTVHSFSEFIHCLQHMNYLNKLCGEKIPCTIFHKTYNATFIYNTYLFMEDRRHLMNFLLSKFGNSVPMQKFKNIVDVFENCLSVKRICN